VELVAGQVDICPAQAAQFRCPQAGKDRRQQKRPVTSAAIETGDNGRYLAAPSPENFSPGGRLQTTLWPYDIDVFSRLLSLPTVFARELLHSPLLHCRE
jgi:hypothetical protein